jgi:hypothetical protein
MKIKAYFVFPIDFISDDPNIYQKLIAFVISIKDQLQVYKKFELCYDSDNINCFLENAMLDGKYLSNYRNQLQTLFRERSRNVCINSMYDSQCTYVNWDMSFHTRTIVLADKIISDISEVTLKGGNETILINISNDCPIDRNVIHVIKDAVHIDGLPIMIRNKTVNNIADFSKWYIESMPKSNMKFALDGNPNFERTGRYARNNEPIYKCKNGNLWYFDNYHKNHFEVFDSQGRYHLGEAYENLELRAGTADSTKLPIRDIMS